ncbi:MAG: recombinase XerD, partial [Pirellulales bacterium]
DETLRMIRAVSDPAGWKLASDIDADGLTSFLVGMKSEGRKPRTVQKYISAAKGFTRWLVETGKLSGNPFASIKAPTPGKGNRRMLLPDEWRHLEAATAAAERYGMTGAERVLLFRVAIETGLRANELRSLTRASLVLDATRPYIVAKAGSTKNRKRAQQYVSAGLSAGLRSHVLRKTPTAPLFALPPK